MRDKPIHVRDARANGRYYIDEELLQVHGPDIGILGIAVYNALAMYTNNQTQECYPSIKTIAGLLAISTVSVVKAIKLLERFGLIHVTHQSRNKKGISDGPNIYTLLDIKKGGIKNMNTPIKNMNTPVNDVNTGYSETLDGGVNDVTSNQTHDNQTHLTNGASAPLTRQDEPLIEILERKYSEAQTGNGPRKNKSQDVAAVITEAFETTFRKPADIPRLQKMARDLNSGWVLIQRILNCTGQKVHDDPHDYLQKAINRDKGGQKQGNSPAPASVIPPELQEKFNRKMARAERVGG